MISLTTAYATWDLSRSIRTRSTGSGSSWRLNVGGKRKPIAHIAMKGSTGTDAARTRAIDELETDETIGLVQILIEKAPMSTLTAKR